MKRQVEHPEYGTGEVIDSRCSGFEVKVHFFGDVRDRWIRIDQLEEPQKNLPPPPPAHALPRIKNPEKFKARRIIEALRLGLIPDDCVADFTYGRDRELNQIKAWLDDRDQGTNLLIGTYGSGKTHFLNYLRYYLLQHDFAVASVEVDPAASPFSKPKRIYSQVAKTLNLKVGGEIRDFRFLIREGVQKRLILDHYYFGHLRESCDDNDTVIWEWIEASETAVRPWEGDPAKPSRNRYADLPALYDNGTSANIYCYLLSTLGWLVRQAAFQKRGLVILFDEAESLYAYGTGTERQRSRNFLKALIEVSNNNPNLLGAACNSGFDFSAHASNIPFMYERESGLKILFAFTDYSFNSPSLENIDPITLSGLNDRLLQKIFAQITELYETAYGYQFNLQQSDRQNMFIRLSDWRQQLRTFIKGCVELLDVKRFQSLNQWTA